MLSFTALAERLRGVNAASGGVYSTSDLGVLLDRSHPSRLTEAIRRLVREDFLLRVRRGLYVDRLNGYRPEFVGQRSLSPSYLSTESALHLHHLCETGITVYTYVTTRLIARRQDASKTFEGHRFVYRHVVAHLFFGYESRDGMLVADPEKAVLDFLYFIYKKQRSALSPDDIDFTQLKPERYGRYLRAYRQTGFKGFALSWLRGRGT